MKYKIAVHPDDYTNPEKPAHSDASSPRWISLLQAAGHSVKVVDAYHSEIIEHVRGCDGFMWRWAHMRGMFQVAQRLLPVLERDLDILTYPNQDTCWHYDDKIAQAYLFSAAGIPTPKTWVWHRKHDALKWAKEAKFPCVLKLATGAASSNVMLLGTLDETYQWIERLFDYGLRGLENEPLPQPWAWQTRMRVAYRAISKGLPPLIRVVHPWPTHRNYLYVQEYLSENEYDTRVTVIGNRAFAFRRFNRQNDFRASGSGKIDWNPEAIDNGFIHLAFNVAHRLRMQSCAIDGLYKNGNPVVGEVSYTYMSDAIQKCPGHWQKTPTGELAWIKGAIWPEEAQIEDYLKMLGERKKR